MKQTIRCGCIALCTLLFSMNSAVHAAAWVNAISIPQGPAESALEAKLRLGRAELAQRKFAKADALFMQAATIDSKSALPWLSLAESARIRNEPAKTKEWLTQALKVAPRAPEALRAWASWHYAQAEYPKALEFWAAALTVNPRDAGVLVDLGDYHLNIVDKPQQASEYYLKALDIDPKRAGALYALGIAYARMGQTQEALKQLLLAESLSPGKVLPVMAMADIYASQKETKLALDAYDKVLRIQPKYYAAEMGRADLLLANGESAKALAAYRSVAKAHPKLTGAFVGAGMAEQQLGQNDAALRSYKVALSLQPDQVLALNNAAWIAAEQGDTVDRGLDWAKKAAALAPGDPRVLGTLAWVHHKRGETDEALKQLTKLVEGIGKVQPESHYLLGIVLSEKGEGVRAAAALREALRLNPSFGQATDANLRLRKLDKG